MLGTPGLLLKKDGGRRRGLPAPREQTGQRTEVWNVGRPLTKRNSHASNTALCKNRRCPASTFAHFSPAQRLPGLETRGRTKPTPPIPLSGG